VSACSRRSASGHREYCKEISLIQTDAQLAVDERAAAVDVGDVKDLPVSATAGAGAESFARTG